MKVVVSFHLDMHFVILVEEDDLVEKSGIFNQLIFLQVQEVFFRNGDATLLVFYDFFVANQVPYVVFVTYDGFHVADLLIKSFLSLKHQHSFFLLLARFLLLGDDLLLSLHSLLSFDLRLLDDVFAYVG